MTEHCQTYLMERNLSFHTGLNNLERYKNLNGGDGRNFYGGFKGSNNDSLVRPGSVQTYYSSMQYYNTPPAFLDVKTIRFQVVIWYVGKIDVVQGRVPATFRVTMFWNADEPATSPPPEETTDGGTDDRVQGQPPQEGMSTGSIGDFSQGGGSSARGFFSTSFGSTSSQTQQLQPQTQPSFIIRPSSPGNNNTILQHASGSAGPRGGSRQNSFLSQQSASSQQQQQPLSQNPTSSRRGSSTNRVWLMQGRHKAVEKEMSEDRHLLQSIDVPPISILNVAGSFDTIGEAEVCMLRSTDRLMRWTCMYRATLMQDHWRVDDFPHDKHDIAIKLAILSQRNKPGATWDKRRWKLGLATADDSQGTTRIPEGLLVDVVSIPEFSLCRDNTDDSGGLSFDFVRLEHGSYGGGADDIANSSTVTASEGVPVVPSSSSLPYSYHHGSNGKSPAHASAVEDTYLQVHFKVQRDSSYYDKNIMPLLCLLNVVAVSITAGMESSDFFQRGLLTLNICFVQIGQRMTLDAKLPSVSYQIKMQRILNEYFLFLLFLVLEGMFVYVLDDHGVSWKITKSIDYIASLAALSHNAYTCATYYKAAKNAQREVATKHMKRVMSSPLVNLPANP